MPLADQAADASAALRWLAERYRLPVGLYGFSQGAWAACVVAAERPDLTWLALVGCSGVSPAVQMRFHTDEMLRRAGFDQSDRDQLSRLRLAVEDVLRGQGDREATGALLARAATRPWFPLAYLPPELPPVDFRWDDLDFDPAPVIARVGCPTLLVYGDQDEAVPADESIRFWRRQGSRELTVAGLSGCGHLPTASAPDAESLTVEDISPDYTEALRAFFGGGGINRAAASVEQAARTDPG